MFPDGSPSFQIPMFICVIQDRLPVVVPRSAAVPLAAFVVAQTRPQGGCGSNLLLPVDMSIEPLDVNSPDILFSRRESAMMIVDVGRDICVELDQLPVLVSKEVVGPLALTAVDLTRYQVGGALVVARPADDDMILQVEVDQDLLSGRIMKPGDPDEESGDQVSLSAVPDVDGDACHTEWRETVFSEMVMEKFVLVPEVCPVVSVTSVAEPTFGPALSEANSPVVLVGGGGVAAAYPLAVGESDTARVSVLPVDGSELPTVFVGKVASDVVGLGVGPSCLRVDSEETLPALLDE